MQIPGPVYTAQHVLEKAGHVVDVESVVAGQVPGVDQLPFPRERPGNSWTGSVSIGSGERDRADNELMIGRGISSKLIRKRAVSISVR